MEGKLSLLIVSPKFIIYDLSPIFIIYGEKLVYFVECSDSIKLSNIASFIRFFQCIILLLK